MKKYKLIKEYPGSPKLNTIFDYWTDGLSEQVYNKSNNPSFIPFKIVKQYSEFWEEVIEKDYEILSFYQESNVHGRYIYFKSHENWKYIEKQNYKIHSVKRLFDGEIFTIGDILSEKSFTSSSRHFLTEDYPYDNLITKIGIVKNHQGEVAGYIKSQNGKLMFSASNRYGNYNVSLEDAKKYKKPLFTTEDGVDIFEGDTIFGVNIDWKVFSHYTDLQNKVKSWGIKPIFSTKKAAEEYIIMNKPCLSINDLLKDYLFSSSLDDLKKLVKSKL
jgi:hypothetical protein